MTEIDKLQKTVRSYESEQDRLNEQLTAHRIELTRLREENQKLKSGGYERGVVWNEFVRIKEENTKLKEKMQYLGNEYSVVCHFKHQNEVYRSALEDIPVELRKIAELHLNGNGNLTPKERANSHDSILTACAWVEAFIIKNALKEIY